MDTNSPITLPSLTPTEVPNAFEREPRSPLILAGESPTPSYDQPPENGPYDRRPHTPGMIRPSRSN